MLGQNLDRKIYREQRDGKYCHFTMKNFPSRLNSVDV